MSERHLQREIAKLTQNLLALCAMVERNVGLAARSIDERDEDLARQVIGADVEVDAREVEVEEEGLKILALYQPVAIDLRIVVAILKINNDLERIGDLAVNMAESSLYLTIRPPVLDKLDFPAMARRVMAMLRKALDTFVSLDVESATQVCASDDEVDELNRHMYRMVEALIEKSHDDAGTLIHLLSISRHLERIADHATNIAEDVIYIANGEIVRHHVADYAVAAHGGKARGN